VKAGSTKGQTTRTAGPKYDKGERRHKHIGRTSTPTIEYDSRRPRKWVGKCPNDISAEECVSLLNEAIAAPTGDRDIQVAKALYTVHRGAIYEAQTSDQGTSYHGYPYKGPLAGALVRQLRLLAIKKDCLGEFEKWVREQIEVRGSGR